MRGTDVGPAALAQYFYGIIEGRESVSQGVWLILRKRKT